MADSGRCRSILPVILLGAWTAVLGQCATATANAPPTEDPRPNRSITLDLARVPLSDLCEVMERRSGVAHRAADVATGDLLAQVTGTLTVAQLQRALATVLGVGWKRVDEGEAACYVAERLPAKRMEEAREQAEADRAFGESVQRLMGAASQPEGAEDHLPPRLRPLLAKPGRREELQVLSSLTPADQAQVLAGGSLDRAVASLSPQTQALIKKMTDELIRGANQRADESLADPGGPRLRRWEPLDLGNGKAWRIRITPTFGVFPPGEPMLSVRVFSPGEFGFGTGWGIPPTLSDGHDPAYYRLPGDGPSTKEAPSEPALPDSFRPAGQNWDEVASDLARILGRAVVSDAYRSAEPVFDWFSTAAKEDSLESYLDRACRPLNRRWGRSGPVLLFQRCDWATLRRAQIPESRLRRWKRQIIDTGRLSVDHLTEMAALTPYQLPNLGMMDAMGSAADPVTAHQELLRLWNSLPADHQSALRGAGRAIRDLPVTVQPRARALVSEMLGSSAPLALANATLRVEQTEEAFTFSVHSPDRPVAAQRIELTCPEPFRERLRNEEAARVAALRAAEQVGVKGPA